MATAAAMPQPQPAVLVLMCSHGTAGGLYNDLPVPLPCPCLLPVAVPVVCLPPPPAAPLAAPPAAPPAEEPAAVPASASSAAAGGAPSLAGRVWLQTQDPEGCWAVQQALEEAASDEEQQALAWELVGHVWEAMHCKHANHVLQKVVITLRPSALQFILDEIMQRSAVDVSQAVRHHFACRVFQRLLEHCRSDQLEQLVCGIVADVAVHARDKYGHFVLQRVVAQGGQEQQQRVAVALAERIRCVGQDGNGCAVLSAVFGHGGGAARAVLARAISRERGLLAQMARTRYGHQAVQAVLQTLPAPEAREVRRVLREAAPSVGDTKWGRLILAQARHEESSKELNNL